MSRIPEHEPAAGNGILNRRIFLEGAFVAGAAGPGVPAPPPSRWRCRTGSKQPGTGFDAYGQPSSFEKVVRDDSAAAQSGDAGVGASRTPLHLLDGMITPSGLHFERSHSGIPDIDPDQHRLVIHGLVKRPLVFTLEALQRYPMQSRIAFIECAGNSAGAQRPAGAGDRQRAGDPRPDRLLGMDRRQALDTARRGRRRSGRAMGDRRGRRCRRHEPQHPARQGDG